LRTLAGDNDFAVINFSIAAAAMAFLLHNFPSGAGFSWATRAQFHWGFLAAALGLLGWLDQLWSLWVPVLIFSPFHRGCDGNVDKAPIARKENLASAS
jgi:UDP-GlcNAc:undecaprenyl-phosphate GlcNAc-1-phosphate transferase